MWENIVNWNNRNHSFISQFSHEFIHIPLPVRPQFSHLLKGSKSYYAPFENTLIYYLTILHMYTTCFDQVYPPTPNLQTLLHTTPHPFSTSSSFSGSYSNSPSSTGAICVHTDVWSFTRPWTTHSRTTPLKAADSSDPCSHQLPYLFSSLRLGGCGDGFCETVSSGHSRTLRCYELVSITACHIQKTLFLNALIQPLALEIFLLPLLQCPLNHRAWGVV